MPQTDIDNFLEKCRGKTVELLMLEHRSWEELNQFILEDISYAGEYASVTGDNAEGKFSFQASRLDKVEYGHTSYSTALMLSGKDNIFYLLHLKN